MIYERWTYQQQRKEASPSTPFGDDAVIKLIKNRPQQESKYTYDSTGDSSADRRLHSHYRVKNALAIYIEGGTFQRAKNKIEYSNENRAMTREEDISPRQTEMGERLLR